MKKGGDQSPSPMRDRFKGRTNLSTSGIGSAKRQWDTGTNAFQGAPLAPYKGTAKGQKSDAKFNNSNSGMGKSASLGSSKGMDIGRPVTAAPSYPGLTGGHGPKIRGGNTGGTIQKGGSSGPDRSPKPMRDRFKGKTHGK